MVCGGAGFSLVNCMAVSVHCKSSLVLTDGRIETSLSVFVSREEFPKNKEISEVKKNKIKKRN